MQTAGLFDLQVNGFAGVDFNSGAIDADQLDFALEAMLATGVAGCVFSHIFFLRNVRARHQAVAAAITGLCVETADRRSASRNRLSRSR